MSDFDRLQMKEDDTIDDFSGKLSSVASKAASLGQIIEETSLVKKFLKSLPRSKFIQIIASLEQVLDLNKTGFEDIVGRLKAYEERIEGETKNDEQEKLMFTNFYSQNPRGGGSMLRGRGRWGQGRGRGRGRTQPANYQEKEKPKKDYSKLICYRCDKPGHFASKCPERLHKLESNLTETQEADGVLYTHEIVFLQENNLVPSKYEVEKGEKNTWYLDNGASNHMTGEKGFFSELDEKVRGEVRFGDGSSIDIRGKGSIVFLSQTGKTRKLPGIYFIPELKHNILSLGQATEHGCEVNMKGDNLTLTDPNGKLLIKVVRTANRLYKAVLEVRENGCFLLKENDMTKTWHERLGHLNYGALSSMVKKNMVVGMSNVKEVNDICDSCLAGKQT